MLYALILIANHNLHTDLHSHHCAVPVSWKIGKLTSKFGPRPNPFKKGEIKQHNGVDIGVPVGTKVYAVTAGKVVFSGEDLPDHGGGILVDIKSGNRYARYGHLSRTLVSVGERVEAGDLIGISGNTGMSTGPHLHFEIFFWDSKKKTSVYIDPMKFICPFRLHKILLKK